MGSDFIDTYGAVGYFLRKLDINTSSRIAMLSSLIHLQDGKKPVEFDTFYDYSLENTGEKLETSSFKTLITKLEDAMNGSDLIIKEDGGYRCSAGLLDQFNEAKKEFDNLTSNLS